MPDVTVHLEGYDEPFSVIVEPWACPMFEVGPKQRCSVVVHHPAVAATVTCAVVRGQMYLTVHDGGSTFTFVREGVVEFTIPPELAVPTFSA